MRNVSYLFINMSLLQKGKSRNSHPEFSSESLVFIELTDADPPQAGGMTNMPFLEWIYIFLEIRVIRGLLFFVCSLERRYE